MTRKKIEKTTPEDRAKWRENHERLERIIERRLAEQAASPEVRSRQQLTSGTVGSSSPRRTISTSGKLSKTTPEQRARQRANQERLQRVIERRLAEEAGRAEASGKGERQ